MRPWLLALWFWLSANSAFAVDDLEAREASLAAQLRCVVCQNQTVAESQAPIAKDMRREIANQLEQGRSDEEIVAFFEQRYGTFVRYAPPWNPSTWLLWCLPFVALLAGFAVLWRTLRRRSNVVTRLTPQERLRAKAWLEKDEESATHKDSA